MPQWKIGGGEDHPRCTLVAAAEPGPGSKCGRKAKPGKPWADQITHTDTHTMGPPDSVCNTKPQPFPAEQGRGIRFPCAAVTSIFSHTESGALLGTCEEEKPQDFGKVFPGQSDVTVKFKALLLRSQVCLAGKGKCVFDQRVDYPYNDFSARVFSTKERHRVRLSSAGQTSEVKCAELITWFLMVVGISDRRGKIYRQGKINGLSAAGQQLHDKNITSTPAARESHSQHYRKTPQEDIGLDQCPDSCEAVSVCLWTRSYLMPHNHRVSAPVWVTRQTCGARLYLADTAVAKLQTRLSPSAI
ncbi:hypothetical protein Bbelb_222570 [Branchiostoma belcheri]|nr:hypothetical protein Bbelb_222570 [Branchiostoma belcheri]